MTTDNTVTITTDNTDRIATDNTDNTDNTDQKQLRPRADQDSNTVPALR
jgi:hypothetical protein